ncbi:MAG: carbon-nitrogen hydrolase family protein [Actinobacteria bacterium]|nr:carbon-nitrogen hydrolase family protein [Actinomycetota bacterium]
MLKVGMVQMRAEPLDVEENLLVAAGYIAKCAEGGARLVVLPEMFNVGFHLGESLMMLAEPLDGKTMTWLRQQASRHGVYIMGSIYESFEEHFYNTMVMVGDDGSVQHYRKRNPTWSESAVWRRSGEPGPGIFDTPFGRIGGVICFDSFARETYEGFRRSGVEAVVIVALWGAPTTRSFHWRPDLVLSRAGLKRWSKLASDDVPRQYARELGVPVVFVNQCGRIRMTSPIPFPDWPVQNAYYEFIGSSHVLDASGETVARADRDEEDFCAVAAVELETSPGRPEISRVDIPARYLSKDYYFVQPPLECKLLQVWFLGGLVETEYEARRVRHIF